MIERFPMGPANILAYEFSEELTESDVERLHDELREAIEEYGSVKLYTDVRKMQSMTPRAVLEDMKLLPEYVSDIDRYAVVGDERWQEWVTKLGDLVTRGEAQYFEPREASRARRWLRREYTFDEEARRVMTTSRPGRRASANMASKGGLVRGLVRAIWAGSAATWAMERVTKFIRGRQEWTTVARERMADIQGGDPTRLLANRVARRLAVRWSRDQSRLGDMGIDHLVGVLTTAVYDALRSRTEFAGRSRGLLFGLAAFVVIDQGIKPLVGASASPRSYPLQTHLRGLAGYLAFGVTADGALRALDGVEEALDEARRRQEIDYRELVDEVDRIRPYGGETDLERFPRPWQPRSR